MMARQYIVITGTVLIVLATILLTSFGHLRDAVSVGSAVIQSHISATIAYDAMPRKAKTKVRITFTTAAVCFSALLRK